MRVLDFEHLEFAHAPSALSASVVDDVVVADYLRQSLWDLVTFRGMASGAYVTSITNNVRRQLSPIWPKLDSRRPRRPSEREQQAEGDRSPDSVRRLLESLEDLGELAHVGDGYYRPTPTRGIRLSEEDNLLISGAPTAHLEKALGQRINRHWVVRTIETAHLPRAVRNNEAFWQTLESWLCIPTESLVDWTSAIVDRAMRGLARSGADVIDFEVYVAARNDVQYFKWKPAREIGRPLQGLLLCRQTSSRDGIRRHWLGTASFVDGRLQSDREYQIDYSSTRRLMYGLDLRAQSRMTVGRRRVGRIVRYTFTSLLPAEERRALIALGTERSVKPGKFPLRFDFLEQHAPTIDSLLGRLGIHLRDEHGP